MSGDEYIVKGWHCLECKHLVDWDENYDGDAWFTCALQTEYPEECDGECPMFEEKEKIILPFPGGVKVLYEGEIEDVLRIGPVDATRTFGRIVYVRDIRKEKVPVTMTCSLHMAAHPDLVWEEVFKFSLPLDDLISFHVPEDLDYFVVELKPDRPVEVQVKWSWWAFPTGGKDGKDASRCSGEDKEDG